HSARPGWAAPTLRGFHDPRPAARPAGDHTPGSGTEVWLSAHSGARPGVWSSVRVPAPPGRCRPKAGWGPEIGRTLEAMESRVRRALETERTIDITTTGRTSGRPRRIEMWFHNLDGRLYLTGTPGSRDWYANLLRHPAFT